MWHPHWQETLSHSNLPKPFYTVLAGHIMPPAALKHSQGFKIWCMNSTVIWIINHPAFCLTQPWWLHTQHIILKHIILNKGVYSRVKETCLDMLQSVSYTIFWGIILLLVFGSWHGPGRGELGVEITEDMWEDIWNNMKKRARTLQLKILHGVHLSPDRLSKFTSTTSSLCLKGKLNPSSLTHRLWCHHTLQKYGKLSGMKCRTC